MTKKIKIADLPEFDMAEHLPDEQAIAEYLTVVLEEDDPAALADALAAHNEAESVQLATRIIDTFTYYLIEKKLKYNSN